MKYIDVKNNIIKMKLKHLNTFENYDTDDDMMTPEEIKQEVLDIIKDLKKNTNTWAARDTLRNFTEWGFWKGDSMASIDIELANEIADELYNYVNEFTPGHPNIEEVYDALYSM